MSSFGSAIPGLGQALGGIIGSNYQNPANAGMDYLNQIPGTVTPYYNPYINAGQQSLSDLMSQFGQLTSNPGQKYSQIGQGFQESPGYNFQYNQAMNASNNAAAAGGMLGSPSHQMTSANMASNLANQDYYNYMNQVMGLYGQGLGGMQGINQMGYGASNELANILSSNLLNQAGMAYNGQANQNQANASRLNNIFGGVSSALSSFF